VNGSTATISGPVANGGIVKDGAGVLSLNSTANSFAGDVTVAAGTLSLGAAHVLPNGPGKGNVIIHGTLALNGRSDIINGLSGTGIIDGISGTPTLTVGDNNQSGIFSGVIRNTAGTLSLAKIGTGTLVLNGANTYTGPTMVSSGTLIVDGNLDSPVTVTGGALAGNGTLARNLTIQAGGTLRVEIDGPGYDRLRLTGTTSAVTLAGALDLLAAPGLAAGSTYTIIDNSGNSTAVSGAFAGLSNNQEFYEDAQWWRITYTGGTGNDVVLTRLAPTAWQSWQATHFGTGANNPALAGDFVDPDLDGILNLLEYALGASPLVKGLTVLPTSRIAGGRLALTFTRTLSTIDLTLTVQGADTPAGPWSDLASSTTGAPFTALAGTVAETGSGATRNVEVQDQYLPTDPLHPRRFLRLRVSR
jgi:autotransporter-associated beta strand protein